MALIALVAILSGCVWLSSAQDPYLPRASLEAEDASHLVMPGAELIHRVGGERADTIDGPTPSFIGGVYGAQASAADVLTFFRGELDRLGWRSDGRDSISSGESQASAWCKPGMFYRLAIFDPNNYQRAGIQNGARFVTVYDGRIVASVSACR